MNPVSRLRYDRTLTSNRARRMIQWMLTENAPYTQPNGLPSWWPFWSDCLVTNIREAVRAARRLDPQCQKCGSVDWAVQEKAK